MIFAPRDGFGTACSGTGGGAPALILTGHARMHGVQGEAFSVTKL